MPKFFYVAKNKEGEVSNGDMDASDEREVMEELKKEGFWPTLIKKKEEKKKISVSFMDRFVKVSLKSKMIFCRHLAVMIGSGLSLSKALIIIGGQEKNKSFKAVIEKIATDVKKGIGFGDSMAKYPSVFNSVFVSMVRMGEISGNLEEILNILASQLEKDHKLISKVRGAMIYPAVIISVMIIIGVIMMTFVVPKLTSIFKDFGAELPFLTRMIISISDFMAANVILVFGSLIVFVVGTRLFAKTEQGRKIFHKFFIKAPILGQIVVKVNSARFSRILSSLLDSGTSLVESLNITADTLGNYYFKRAVQKAAIDVQKGKNLSEILKMYENVFPYLVIQMIEVGEETGKTPDVLVKLASFYEEEVDQVTKNMTSIIEPVLMVVIGSAVGLFAIAIISPIYSIMEEM